LIFPSASTCTARALDVFFFLPISRGNWATWISGKAPPSPKSYANTDGNKQDIMWVEEEVEETIWTQSSTITTINMYIQSTAFNIKHFILIIYLSMAVYSPYCLAVSVMFTSSARGTQPFRCSYGGGSLREDTTTVEYDFLARSLSSASNWSCDSWVGAGKKL
jgi:hypothetical protein